MSKQAKQLKLVINEGRIRAIYNDALIGLFADASQVHTVRASHVEPDGCRWQADLGPVGGPVLTGFQTRQEALDAEAQYINRHVIK